MQRLIVLIAGWLVLCTLALAQAVTDPDLLQRRAAAFWGLLGQPREDQAAAFETLFSAGIRERNGDERLLEILDDLGHDFDAGMAQRTPELVESDDGTELQYTLDDGRRLALRLELEAAEPNRIERFGLRPLPSKVPVLAAAQLPQAIAEHVQAEHAAERFSGAVLVARGDQLVQALAVGAADREGDRPNTLDTPINLGSMNKMFTAIAIGQLQAQGKLDWQDTVGKHLTDFPNPRIRDQVTIEQLLTHSSGVGSYWNERYSAAKGSIVDQAGFLATFVDEPLLFEPGQGNEYSNGGPVILGLIIEAISGLDYYEYIRQHVYAPAGMQHSDHYLSSDAKAGFAIGYERGPDGQWQDNRSDLGERGSAAGGGYASANDLLAYARALGAGTLLPREQLEVLWQPRLRHGPDFGYGYLFGTGRSGGARWVGHNGGAPGISADFRFFPDNGLTIVVLANQGQAAMAMSQWLDALLAASVEQAPAP